jgi:glutamyl-tRNA synthetase
LAAAVRPLFASASFSSDPIVTDPRDFDRLLDLLRPRAKRLTDFVEQSAPLLADDVEYAPDAVEKHLLLPGLRDHLEALAAAWRAVPDFAEASVEAVLREIAAARGVKAGVLIHATRVAITGRTTSPGLFEVLVLIGRERTLARLDRLVAFLATRA